MNIKVMTYNVRLGIETDLASVGRAVLAEAPDLVAFQEIGVRWNMGEPVDQPAHLAHLVGLTHHAFAGALTDPRGGQFGIALASRWPMEHTEIIWLPRIRDEQRVLLHARLATPDGPLHVLTTHLAILREARERTLQARVVAAVIAALEGPVLLMGDLNDRPTTATLSLIRGGLTDCFDACGEGPEDTFSVAQPHRRIDYVLCGGGLAPTGPCRVITEALASDHFPLVATVGVH